MLDIVSPLYPAAMYVFCAPATVSQICVCTPSIDIFVGEFTASRRCSRYARPPPTMRKYTGYVYSIFQPCPNQSKKGTRRRYRNPMTMVAVDTIQKDDGIMAM